MISFGLEKISVNTICIASIVLIATCAGCEPDEPIVRHRIPKSKSGLDDLRLPKNPIAKDETSSESIPSAPVDQPPSEPIDRMVVGWYEVDESTWFFKITGSIEKLKASESQWLPFLQTVKFESGEPTYELPDGWSVSDQKVMMRHSTLKIGDSGLELAISVLGGTQAKLPNVNRWRGQMGLPRISTDDLDKDLQELGKNKTGQIAYLFDVVGNSPGGGRMPPFANRGSQTTPSVKNQTEKTTPKKTDLKFDAPDGWTTGKQGGIVPVAARLIKEEGDDEVQITVIKLSVSDWDPNAKRWAGEVGMASLRTDELNERTTEIKVDEIDGKQIKLIPDDGEKATIAGMVIRENVAWFLKLTGNKKMVVENEDVFYEFVKSIKFN